MYSEEPGFLGDGSFAAPSKPVFPAAQNFSMGSGVGIRRVVNVVDDKMLIFDPPPETCSHDGDTSKSAARSNRVAYGTNTKRVREHRFVFDRLFDDSSTQEQVYSNTTRPLLDSVLDGYNATVFAYGATGCGKTHTITGTPQEPGIIFLTMKELFERIEELKDTKNVELSLSYLEIYNETIRDLLDPNTQKSLVLREDAVQHISVSNLSTHSPLNVHQVMEMIIAGNQNRTMSPTEANATSSRSHAVLQINIAQKNRTASLSESRTFATLSIIDLAGSERASATKNRGERLLEGANINKSLLALGNCINALCDPRRRNHVPYRDSKLTRLLKFSLGGNCKTVMIVCISPSSKHYDETLNTLKYADRAKKIKTKVVRNQHNLNRHVGSYLKMITEQKQEIEELRARESEVVEVALEQAKRVDEKCWVAVEQAIEQFKNNVTKHYQKHQINRVQAVSKTKELKISISQIKNMHQTFLQNSDSLEQISFEQLDQTIRQCIDYLETELTKAQNSLKTEGYMDGSSISDNAIFDNSITSLLRELKLLRGWNSTHEALFRARAEQVKSETEKQIALQAMEHFTSSSGLVEWLVPVLLKTVQRLGELNESFSQAGQDIKGNDVTQVSDEIIDQIRQHLEEMCDGQNFISTIRDNDHDTSISEWETNSERNINVNPQSSPAPLPNTSHQVGSEGLESSATSGNILSSTAPKTRRESLMRSRHPKLVKKRDSIALNHLWGSGRRTSGRGLYSSSIPKAVSPSSPMPKPAGSGYPNLQTPVSLRKSGIPELNNRKQRLSMRSPIKAQRKTAKRVRWEDDQKNVIGHGVMDQMEQDQHTRGLTMEDYRPVVENNLDDETNNYYGNEDSMSNIEESEVSTFTGSQVGVDADQMKNTPDTVPAILRTPQTKLFSSLGPKMLRAPSSLPRFTKPYSLESNKLRQRRRSSLLFGRLSRGAGGGLISNENKQDVVGFGSAGAVSGDKLILKSPGKTKSVALPVDRANVRDFLFNSEPIPEYEKYSQYTRIKHGDYDVSDELMPSFQVPFSTSANNTSLTVGSEPGIGAGNDVESKINTNTSIMNVTGADMSQSDQESRHYRDESFDSFHNRTDNSEFIHEQEVLNGKDNTSFEPMDLDSKGFELANRGTTESDIISATEPADLNNESTKANVKPDTSAKEPMATLPSPISTKPSLPPPRANFGVKGSLRRKSSILPGTVVGQDVLGNRRLSNFLPAQNSIPNSDGANITNNFDNKLSDSNDLNSSKVLSEKIEEEEEEDHT